MQSKQTKNDYLPLPGQKIDFHHADKFLKHHGILCEEEDSELYKLVAEYLDFIAFLHSKENENECIKQLIALMCKMNESFPVFL
jgi:hypothetical protein